MRDRLQRLRTLMIRVCPECGKNSAESPEPCRMPRAPSAGDRRPGRGDEGACCAEASSPRSGQRVPLLLVVPVVCPDRARSFAQASMRFPGEDAVRKRLHRW